MNSPARSNSLILEAQADFSLNLLREVSKDGRSCIVSPLSVAIALSMVYAGAKERTGQEIGQLLAGGALESEVHKYFGDLLRSIKSGHNNYSLELANKVYIKDGFEVLDAFKAQIMEHYGGQFEAVNFGDKEGTAKKINDFVEEATHGKIHDLIEPNLLGEMTRLVLINAVYFKGNWANKFNPNLTKKKTFHVDEINTKELDMMHKKADFIYFEDDQLQLLGMPYQGGEVFMFVLLPKDRFGLAKLLADLDGKKLLELTKERRKSEVQVVLPKFKLESTHALNQPLANMGMATAFSDSANFGGIAPDSLKISEVVQKAFIENNEAGSEAAAATGLIMVERSLLIIRPPTIEFIADHPFNFMIVRSGGQLLFLGTFSE
ncbi:hypothetical protein niasHS_011594 [Heterodera schachtii]|uniref:Serpin domain-containing protein n=1 Tax=Heterodera schachtii TaxID=97005 RepID=A0ABD2IF88_HETSC